MIFGCTDKASGEYACHPSTFFSKLSGAEAAKLELLMDIIPELIANDTGSGIFTVYINAEDH